MIRIGHGYDIHRLEPGDGLVLGGVRIACEWQVIAHSDGDVLMHALCDAMLGALALGDIGQHFPDTDERWREADSGELLAEVASLVAGRGYQVGNADLTLIAEVPRVAPCIDAMRETIASRIDVAVDAVSVKATTHETLDAVGQCEGIAAHAVVVLVAQA